MMAKLETVGELPDAIVNRIDGVEWKESYQTKWIGGYFFTLPNGFVASVQFAPGLYGDYHHDWIFEQLENGLTLNDVYDGEFDFSDSKTAEFVIHKNGDWYHFDTMQIVDDETRTENERCLGEFIAADEIFHLIVKFSKVVC